MIKERASTGYVLLKMHHFQYVSLTAHNEVHDFLKQMKALFTLP